MKTWTKKAKVLAAALAVSLGAVLISPATPAYATNYVACNERGYLKIGYLGLIDGFPFKMVTCFANKGELELEIGDAIDVWSGNNAGYVIDDTGFVRFGKNETKSLSGVVDFLHID